MAVAVFGSSLTCAKKNADLCLTYVKLMVAEGLGQRPAPKARAEGARRKCWSILARRGARPHRPYVRTYVRRLGPAAHEAPAHHARVQSCAPSQSGGHPLLGGPPTLKEIHHWNRRSFSPGALRVPLFLSFVRSSQSCKLPNSDPICGVCCLGRKERRDASCAQLLSPCFLAAAARRRRYYF